MSGQRPNAGHLPSAGRGVVPGRRVREVCQVPVGRIGHPRCSLTWISARGRLQAARFPRSVRGGGHLHPWHCPCADCDVVPWSSTDPRFAGLLRWVRLRRILGSTPTEGLLDTHRKVHAALADVAEESWSVYEPGTWVPHCTLAMNADHPERLLSHLDCNSRYLQLLAKRTSWRPHRAPLSCALCDRRNRTLPIAAVRAVGSEGYVKVARCDVSTASAIAADNVRCSHPDMPADSAVVLSEQLAPNYRTPAISTAPAARSVPAWLRAEASSGA